MTYPNLELSKSVPTPSYIVDEGALRRNLETLAEVQERAGCTIILALKGFAMWSTFPLVREYLRGTTASSVNEARLGREEFGGEVHVYAPAYGDDEMNPLLDIADHVTFNSFSQWNRHKPRVAAHHRRVKCGIRINPEHSEVEVALYDPCAPCSRLGMTEAQFRGESLDGITGLHFHTLCELNSDALERTLGAVEKRFGKYIAAMEWVNFGGGHHITRPDYDKERLIRLVSSFRDRYDVKVYLEPGEAIALNTGVLVASVLDVFHNGVDIAILDTSATAHMPDVLEMPYRPQIVGAGMPGEKAHTYRLGGLTCLAGDVIGDYSFETPLKAGDRLVFLDMAHYSMVKNTTFNGVPLPSIGIYNPDTRETRIVRRFGYEDYKGRLS
ncbi:MAG: carboxynorspermidine decarboxylase [Candidatus Hydrogenedentes bacterium]|nr:carboxynorspermidine decarboxylase [Candidatus Hydrogenedentota bacterium]